MSEKPPIDRSVVTCSLEIGAAIKTIQDDLWSIVAEYEKTPDAVIAMSIRKAGNVVKRNTDRLSSILERERFIPKVSEGEE